MAKQLINNKVIFDASAKTLDFGSIENFDIRFLFAVINQTKGQYIYCAGDSSLHYSAINGSVVTLTFDTTTHADNDILLVLYEEIYASDMLTEAFINILGWLANARSNTDAMRVLLEAGSTTAVTGTLTGVTTITNVATITALGSVPIDTNYAFQQQNILFELAMNSQIKIT